MDNNTIKIACLLANMKRRQKFAAAPQQPVGNFDALKQNGQGVRSGLGQIFGGLGSIGKNIMAIPGNAVAGAGKSIYQAGSNALQGAYTLGKGIATPFYTAGKSVYDAGKTFGKGVSAAGNGIANASDHLTRPNYG